MARVEFVMDGLVVECEDGSRLMDVCRDAGASVPFGCANGVCGTCVCRVLSGSENLSAPSARERQTLEMFRTDPEEYRCICQCTVFHGDVKIESS